MFDILLKHLGQKMENIENYNKRRLDAMERTNTTMLKAMCNLVKQDYNQLAKDVAEDAAMNGARNSSTYDETLRCGNPNKAMSKATARCGTKEAYRKCRVDLKNIETIFILGGDDDDFPMLKNNAMKAKFLGQENNNKYSYPEIVNLSRPNEVKTIDDSSPQ